MINKDLKYFAYAAYNKDERKPSYSKGVYKTDNFQMIIGSGIGYSKIPFRIFNPPEICTITLEKE